MATRIRLRRVGRKGVPLYRIVIADRESPRDGRFIATIGTYNPKGTNDAEKVRVDGDQAGLARVGATDPGDEAGAVVAPPQLPRQPDARHLGDPARRPGVQLPHQRRRRRFSDRRCAV